MARWNEHLAKRRTVSDLHKLSDRELSDIGIHRSDIHRAVYNGLERAA